MVDNIAEDVLDKKSRVDFYYKRINFGMVYDKDYGFKLRGEKGLEKNSYYRIRGRRTNFCKESNKVFDDIARFKK